MSRLSRRAGRHYVILMSTGRIRSPYTVAWHRPNEPRRRGKEFPEGLTPQCTNKYWKLVRNLQLRGPDLAQTPMLAHVSGDVWELREVCDSGALRIYLFREGDWFFLVCGEVKNGQSKANAFLVAKTQRSRDAYKESGRSVH